MRLLASSSAVPWWPRLCIVAGLGALFSFLAIARADFPNPNECLRTLDVHGRPSYMCGGIVCGIQMRKNNAWITRFGTRHANGSIDIEYREVDWVVGSGEATDGTGRWCRVVFRPGVKKGRMGPNGIIAAPRRVPPPPPPPVALKLGTPFPAGVSGQARDQINCHKGTWSYRTCRGEVRVVELGVKISIYADRRASAKFSGYVMDTVSMSGNKFKASARNFEMEGTINITPKPDGNGTVTKCHLNITEYGVCSDKRTRYSQYTATKGRYHRYH